MKKIAILTILMGLVQSLQAVEYFTLSTSSKSVTVAPNSLVEALGGTIGGVGVLLEFTLANGDIIKISASPDVNAWKQKLFTNATQVRIYASNNAPDLEGAAVTLKVTPAAEIESAGPKTVLVIPENSTGDYDVVIESSGDMTTWTPMHSQTVTGSGPQHFFRTRIVKR